MKGFIVFVLGWLGMYLLFAFVCLLANMDTMTYKQCLSSETTQTISFIFGWIGGVVAASETE